MAMALALSGIATGCSLLATPVPPTVGAPSPAPAGGIGYVVCPDEVTPVELATRTAEAPIRLPISGTPALGDFAIATSPAGRWAFVGTTTSVSQSAPSSRGSSTSGKGSSPGSQTTTRSENVVVPIDLTSQWAMTPIVIPGQGGTHAIAVMPNGRIVLTAIGSAVVPVDAVTRDVGTPLHLGAGHTVYGLALDPVGPMAYALVNGGVIPFDTADATAGTEIPTGMSVSSVYSQHGVVVSADGTTVYTLGQGGQEYGGRVVPIAAASGSTLPATSFDAFGVTDPAALAFAPGGTSLLVVEGPGRTGVFVVAGFDTVIPYTAAARTFGRPIAVCSGATSMVVARSP